MLNGLSYASFGLLVMIQKQFGDRPFILKDVLNRGESHQFTRRLLRELVNEGYLSSGQLKQVATGYFSVSQYRLINPLAIAFMDEETTENSAVKQPVPVDLGQ